RGLQHSVRRDAADAKLRIAELLDAGDLRPIAVEGWAAGAYLARNVESAPSIEARALLAPFDPLIWQREWAEAVFGARIRLEIYVPRHKRCFGYYVLPLLLGERIVARVDLKADRRERALRVEAAHAEAGIAALAIVEALAVELQLLAAWLDLERIAVAGRGDLGGRLQHALRHHPRPCVTR